MTFGSRKSRVCRGGIVPGRLISGLVATSLTVIFIRAWLCLLFSRLFLELGLFFGTRRGISYKTDKITEK